MIDNLKALHIQGLQAIYDAELQKIEGAQSIADAVTTPELKQAMDEGLEKTRQRIPRLEAALQSAGAATDRVPNDVMKGILSVGSKIQNETSEPNVRDAGIIASAQIGMHYFIAAYGTMRAYAETLGLSDVAQMSGETVQELKQADERMSQIAEQIVNQKAQSASS